MVFFISRRMDILVRPVLDGRGSDRNVQGTENRRGLGQECPRYGEQERLGQECPRYGEQERLGQECPRYGLQST